MTDGLVSKKRDRRKRDQRLTDGIVSKERPTNIISRTATDRNVRKERPTKISSAKSDYCNGVVKVKETAASAKKRPTVRSAHSARRKREKNEGPTVSPAKSDRRQRQQRATNKHNQQKSDYSCNGIVNKEQETDSSTDGSKIAAHGNESEP